MVLSPEEKILYQAATYSSSSILVIDISDVNHPSLIDIQVGVRIGTAYDLKYLSDDIILMSSAGNDGGLFFMNISNRTSPVLSDSQLDGWFWELSISTDNQFAFVVDELKGTYILEIDLNVECQNQTVVESCLTFEGDESQCLCKECIENYLVYNQECFLQCPGETLKEDHSCVDQCDTDYYLYQSVCYSECPNTTFYEDD